MPTAFLDEVKATTVLNEMEQVHAGMVESDVTEGRPALQVFVADRGVYLDLLACGDLPSEKNLKIEIHRGNAPSGLILADRMFGESDRLPFFREVAISKLMIMLRTGKSVYDVRLCERRADDTRYYGGVLLGNIAVAPSGAQAYYDEMLAGVTAYNIQALMKEEAHAFEKTDDPWLV